MLHYISMILHCSYISNTYQIILHVFQLYMQMLEKFNWKNYSRSKVKLQFVSLVGFIIDWYQSNWQHLVLYNFDIVCIFVWHRIWLLRIWPYHFSFDSFSSIFGLMYADYVYVLFFFSKCTGFLWVFHVYKVTQFRAIYVLYCTYLWCSLYMWVPVVLFRCSTKKKKR